MSQSKREQLRRRVLEDMAAATPASEHIERERAERDALVRQAVAAVLRRGSA